MLSFVRVTVVMMSLHSNRTLTRIPGDLSSIPTTQEEEEEKNTCDLCKLMLTCKLRLIGYQEGRKIARCEVQQVKEIIKPSAFFAGKQEEKAS